jgi:hypothetical protein
MLPMNREMKEGEGFCSVNQRSADLGSDRCRDKGENKTPL